MPVYASHETHALEIVQRALKADGPFTVNLLSGGLSGSTLLKVTTSRQSYVVRFWNMQWAECFPQDLVCQSIASDTGYGPRLFYSDEAAGITIIEYLCPETFPKRHERLQVLVDLLKKIHAGPVVPVGIDRATELDESIVAVVKLNPRFLDLSAIRAVKETVFAALRLDACNVPCHRDLHPGNLIYTQNHFVAIDYTWGGMGDPYADLATVAIFNCVTSEEEQRFLQLYLGHAPTPTEIARLSLMKLSAKIFYGLEFLKLSPACALNSTIKPTVVPKSYMNFGLHGGALPSPVDFFEYAISLLDEVVDYSRSEQYGKDIALLLSH